MNKFRHKHNQNNRNKENFVRKKIGLNLLLNKKGVSIWISWVLLAGFAVTLSTFMYYFFSDYTTKSIDNVKTRVIDSKLCDNVGISASVCLKSPSELTISVKNVNYITIDKLSVDLYDVFDRPQQKSKEFRIVAGTRRQFDLLKDGIIKEIHIVPVVYKDGKSIFCSNKEATIADIVQC